VLSVDADRSLVLFSSSDELTEFRRRIEAYGEPVPKGQKHPKFSAFVHTTREVRLSKIKFVVQAVEVKFSTRPTGRRYLHYAFV
jgi:hypothetical protein